MIQTLQNCTKPIKLKTGLIVPCGQCLLCRMKNAVEWNLRSKHQLITDKGKASFITLTYKTRFLPKKGYLGKEIIRKSKTDTGGNLRQEDLTKFIKKLRIFIERKFDKRKIKYIGCGEYGSEEFTYRPHYHLIVFNLSPSELDLSTIVHKLWKKGKTDVSEIDATDHAVQYITGYCRKKRLDKESKIENYYSKGRFPPFQCQSKGIGKDWALKNFDKWVKTLTTEYEGEEISIPRYYIKVIKKIEGETICYDYSTSVLPMGKGKIIHEKKYKLIENLYGEKTEKLNKALFKKKYENLEKIKNDKTILKRIDYFNIIAHEEKEINIHWDFYKKKCAEFVDYYISSRRNLNKYLKKMRDRNTTENRIKKGKFKSRAGKKWKEPDIWIFKEMNKIAKTKEYIIEKGSFGKRNKIA